MAKPKPEEQSWKINQRPGIELYFTEAGYVAISELEGRELTGMVVRVHPENLPKAIQYLQEINDAWLAGDFMGPDGEFGNERPTHAIHTMNGHAK